jgi:hypothetical protein
MISRKGEGAIVGKREQWLAHPGELSLEEAMDLSHMQENIIGYFAE